MFSLCSLLQNHHLLLSLFFQSAQWAAHHAAERRVTSADPPSFPFLFHRTETHAPRRSARRLSASHQRCKEPCLQVRTSNVTSLQSSVGMMPHPRFHGSL